MTAISSATSASGPEAQVPWRQDASVIGLVGLAHATSHFSHLLLPPLFPLLMAEFGLSFAQVGALVTAFFVVSGVGQAASGFVVDRMGARPILFGSIFLFALSAAVAAGANGYAMLMLSAVLAGLGNAPFHPVDFSILNQRVSGPRLGYAFSAHGLAGNLGWALAPVSLVTLATVFHWRVAMLAAVALYAVVLLVLWRHRAFLHTHAVSGKRAPVGAAPASSLAFLQLPVVWWCFAFFFLSTMTLAVVQSFAPSILQTVHGVGLQAASATITAYMLCGAVGMLVGGVVAARAGYRSNRVVAVALVAGALLLLAAASGVGGALGAMVALAATGFAVGVGGPSRDLMIKQATPKGATGRVYGTVYSGLDVGFAVSPALFGLMMDQGWYQATLAGAALTLLLAVVAALAVGQRSAAAGLR